MPLSGVYRKKRLLYRKLQKYAERDGVRVEAVVDMLLTLGSNVLLEQRLAAMERMRK